MQEAEKRRKANRNKAPRVEAVQDGSMFDEDSDELSDDEDE